MPPITPEPVPAQPQIEAHEDVAAICATVGRALSPLATPTRPELVELEQQLRSHVEMLLPSAEAAVDELWHGSADRYQHRERLDRIRRHAGQGLGLSSLSAHVQVRHLARDCAALLEYLEAER